MQTWEEKKRNAWPNGISVVSAVLELPAVPILWIYLKSIYKLSKMATSGLSDKPSILLGEDKGWWWFGLEVLNMFKC